MLAVLILCSWFHKFISIQGTPVLAQTLQHISRKGSSRSALYDTPDPPTLIPFVLDVTPIPTSNTRSWNAWDRYWTTPLDLDIHVPLHLLTCILSGWSKWGIGTPFYHHPNCVLPQFSTPAYSQEPSWLIDIYHILEWWRSASVGYCSAWDFKLVK